MAAGGVRQGLQGVAMLGFALLLIGCSVPKEIDPVRFYNRVSGNDEAKRLPPPGMDQPRPNLGMIPPRPERPPPGAFDALSAALAEDRARSREPQPSRAAAAAPAAAASQGNPPVPAGPPPAPLLAAVPEIPWTVPAAVPATPAATPPAAAPPVMPAAPPPVPPSELLGLPRSP